MPRRTRAAGSLQDGAAPVTSPSSSSSIAPASSSAPGPRTLRKRPRPATAFSPSSPEAALRPDDEKMERPAATEEGSVSSPPASWVSRNQWVVFALTSGACAAFNGVFAKLTTNGLTSNLSQAIATILGLNHFESVIEVAVRCMFFGLNLFFNGVMWTLFTKALARGSSTTQVSIMNTSANFMITAVLGFMIFSESLPPLWWLGAAMLVAGNVIIGQKEGNDGDDKAAVPAAEAEGEEEPLLSARDGGVVPSVVLPPDIAVAQLEGVLPLEKDDEDEDVALIGAVGDD
ncbi:hypothetical protein BX600DRAFT_24844 [Xylariales sp. PMI_506]|nr:hypothetical protein BX600DRAFT_24844 [Xylariales sp. PMI_506]